MDHPNQIFSRIRRQRARAALPRQGAASAAPRVAPAPIPPDPASAPPAAPPSAAIPPAANTPRTSPRPAGGHALYSQVMRSHDRMGTRHL